MRIWSVRIWRRKLCMQFQTNEFMFFPRTDGCCFFYAMSCMKNCRWKRQRKEAGREVEEK